MIRPLPEITFTFPHIGNKTLTLQQLIRQDARTEDSYVAEIIRFLNWWYQTEESLVITTSGTTGKPVPNRFDRQQVISAARSSMPIVGPPEHGTSLLAIHNGYAGGRMLLIRALLAENNLICIPPSANPLRMLPDIAIDYASFVPYQIYEILKAKSDTQRLSTINTVLIGGAAISENNWRQLCTLPNRIFSTYGMTETLSHIALKQAVIGEFGYTPIPGINLSIDDRGCLVIESEWLGKIITHDLVEWTTTNGSSKQFNWKGRADTIINSGGILVSPEKIEDQLGSFFSKYAEVTAYFIFGEQDEQLGQRVVLYIERKPQPDETHFLSELTNYCRLHLSKEEIPRRIQIRPTFLRTGSGKIDRRGTAAEVMD